MANKPHPVHEKNKGKLANSRTKKGDAERANLKKRFLKWYEKGGALYWAAAKINRTAETIGMWRKDDADFDAAVLNAFEKSTDKLKVTAYERAIAGSDNLLMFLTKQRDPSYRDRFGIDGTHLHAGVIANPTRVPPAVQAAVDAMSVEAVKKIIEKL